MTVTAGRTGRTLCPLRPYGRVEIDGESHEAKTEGGWIDTDVDVVVVEVGNFSVLVREDSRGLAPDSHFPEQSSRPRGDSITPVGGDNYSRTTNPFHGPEFWLERVNTILVGVILGLAMAGVFLLAGHTISFEFLLLPVGGAISGAIFRHFIYGSRDLEGPYSDHRPKAYMFVVAMFGGAALAVVAAMCVGGGVLGVAAGLVLGTLCGAMVLVAAHVV